MSLLAGRVAGDTFPLNGFVVTPVPDAVPGLGREHIWGLLSVKPPCSALRTRTHSTTPASRSFTAWVSVVVAGARPQAFTRELTSTTSNRWGR